jgi:hypothetical protein
MASVGWRKWLGVPVEAKVAESFWPMRPLLPMPPTTREPWRGSVVAGGVFLTKSVPAGHLVTGPKLQLRVLSIEDGI